ncbi:MAG TPA: Hpt domain-containing protein, partial [Thermoanaerobaculia bacterium]|nr:Hpt domain-containing protein [Thermoanaerobaculia bacterium]
MEHELADLVPVFVEEARERIDHLTAVTPRVPAGGEAAIVAKRELHTLKGSARMLGLDAFAELCHAAEDALAAGRPRLVELLTRTADRLAAMLAVVAAGEEPEADGELLTALRAGDGEAPAAAKPKEAEEGRSKRIGRRGEVPGEAGVPRGGAERPARR